MISKFFIERPVLANVIAITLCGLLNFWLGETFVFSRAG